MTKPIFFVPCYVEGKGDALAVCRLDTATGGITQLSTFGEGVQNPLYCTPRPTGKFLYVADFTNECDGVKGGTVAAYALDGRTHTLKYLNRQSSGGTVPCYVTVTRDNRFALVANYGDGTISVLPIDKSGQLGAPIQTTKHEGADPKKKPNAHSVILTSDERFAIAADLGVDRIFIYQFDNKTGTLVPHTQPFVQTESKAGPRHVTFDPTGRFLYAMTEYDNTVIVMTFDAEQGTARIIQTESALPAGFTGKSYGSDIQVHPSGRFLYAANRGHESVVTFAIDPATGRIALVGHEMTMGKFPRGMAIDASGSILIVGNEKSDAIVTFHINAQNGQLTPTGQTFAVPRPAGVFLV